MAVLGVLCAARVYVTDGAGVTARERSAFDAGIPSRAMMQRAGAAAAGEIARRFPLALQRGVAVYAGRGNNGGDAWVVAGALAAAGIAVRVAEQGEPTTADAAAERQHARTMLPDEPPRGDEGIVVDGLLGIGAHGAPRGVIATSIDRIARARAGGAVVVALDLPSGVDAATGCATDAVVADCTLVFGTMKRGLLVARRHAGAIAVLDVGLGAHADIGDGAPALIDANRVRTLVPPIAFDAHKGVRGHVAIVGGAAGMAGAALLAARAALRSGVGLVRLAVAGESIAALQAAVPEALAGRWPDDTALASPAWTTWPDAMLIGPGLGAGAESRALVERVLAAWRGPVVLDADALNAFAADLPSLRTALGTHRPALLTPHPAELARLAGCSVDAVLARRFEIGADVACATGAAVLLKGVPTVISVSAGARWVSASGNAVLATGGSGDILGGIAAALLAQMVRTSDATPAADDEMAGRAGAAAAWIHGRAAEHALEAANASADPFGVRSVRGAALTDVLASLPAAWRDVVAGLRPCYPVLAELPSVASHR